MFYETLITFLVVLIAVAVIIHNIIWNKYDD